MTRVLTGATRVTYICLVCGYDQLDSPPVAYLICPSCGVEFGYDDFATGHEELRQRWITGGMQWWSRHERPPPDWSPVEQLLRITPPTLA